MNYLLRRSLWAILVLVSSFAPIYSLAQPFLPEDVPSPILTAFLEHPEISQIEVVVTSGDTTIRDQLITIDRAARKVTTQSFGFDPEQEGQASLSTRSESIYNEHWLLARKEYFSSNGDMRWWTIYEYTDDQLLLVQSTYMNVSRGEPAEQVVSESHTTYEYEGAERRLLGWERVSTMPGFDSDITRATVRYDKEGRRTRVKNWDLNKAGKNTMIARVYRWKYNGNEIEQRVENLPTGKMQKLRQWLDEEGRLLREEIELPVYDTQRTYFYEGNLLNKINYDFVFPNGELKQSERVYHYK